ncbi:MAG: GNAT family N-acetyltransferase [Ktedonobacteraceae bacterium]
MSEAIMVTSQRTEELNAETRASIIHVCRTAHQEDEFTHLFSYIPSGGIHVLAYREQELIGHAVATTRWLQPEGLPLLRTAYIDAVATLPAYQGQGIGSTLMRHLATVLSDFEMACLQTERVSFYARVGWEVWRGPLAGRRATELLPTPDQKGVMILRLAHTPPLDIDRLLVIEYAGRIW